MKKRIAISYEQKIIRDGYWGSKQNMEGNIFVWRKWTKMNVDNIAFNRNHALQVPIQPHY
jgi:hypothetical protein